MNSRTDHHAANPSLTLSAQERYQNFIRSSTNGGLRLRQGNSAKQNTAEKKMDDVFRRLHEDATNPSLDNSQGACPYVKFLSSNFCAVLVHLFIAPSDTIIFY